MRAPPRARSLGSRNERPPKVRSPKGSRCPLGMAAAISPGSPAAVCGLWGDRPRSRRIFRQVPRVDVEYQYANVQFICQRHEAAERLAEFERPADFTVLP